MSDSGLKNQTIGKVGISETGGFLDTDGSFYNVYHLLIPYYIGDNRINISPVYIYDYYQTSLSLSKTGVKFGEYFYPTSVSNNKLFVLNVNKIVQTDKVIATTSDIKIGDNRYVIEPVNNSENYYFSKNSDGKFYKNNIGLTINDYKAASAISNWNGIEKNVNNITAINFGALSDGDISYNGDVSYVCVQQFPGEQNYGAVVIGGGSVLGGINTFVVGADVTVQIPVNSNGGRFSVSSNARITGLILNDSTI